LANEELISSNEELQSANEEVESANAELEQRVAERTEELATANAELRANHERLKQDALQLARLAAIVESSEDAIIGGTLDELVESWNAGAERLYGYTAEEMIGRPIITLVPPDREKIPPVPG
jgi:PAS domain-containing protein